jgi:hypothetical protein
MPQHEDLELLRTITLGEQHQKRKQPADDEVHQRDKQRQPPKTGDATLQPCGSQLGRPRPSFHTPRAIALAASPLLKDGAARFPRVRVRRLPLMGSEASALLLSALRRYMRLTARSAAMSCALDIPERPAMPAAWARRYNSVAVKTRATSKQGES